LLIEHVGQLALKVTIGQMMENTQAARSFKIYVSAYLPFRLEADHCRVRVGQETVILQITNPERPFFSSDGLLADDLGRLWRLIEASLGPVETVQLYSSVAICEIIVSDFSTSQIGSNLVKSLTRRLKKAIRVEVLPAMNKLVDAIRLENRVPYLSPIRIFHLQFQVVEQTPSIAQDIEFELRRWLRGDVESQPWYWRFPWSKYVLHAMTFDIPDQKILMSDTALRPGTMLLADAENLFTLGQYGSAVVMAHSAVDAAVSAFVSRQFKLKGLSEKDIRGFLINNALPAKLDLVLRLLFDFNLKDDIRLWESFTRMNSLRNDIVHRGDLADDSEVENAIETSRKITELIGQFRS
jgi:HEPN domain-containing protein